MVFDVSTAFLSGLEMSREVYAKVPREGLPAVERWDAVLPFALLRLLKGAYGLTEAPRLWYLRARQLLQKLGFEEMQCARATFVYRLNGVLIAFLVLHVDDGMLFGNMQDGRFRSIREAINRSFNIKFWKVLSEDNPVDYLGLQWTLVAGNLNIQMNEYISKIEKIEPQR
jgi:hypothetical protein